MGPDKVVNTRKVVRHDINYKKYLYMYIEYEETPGERFREKPPTDRTER